MQESAGPGAVHAAPRPPLIRQAARGAHHRSGLRQNRHGRRTTPLSDGASGRCRSRRDRLAGRGDFGEFRPSYCGGVLRSHPNSSSIGLFREFHREYRPLSAHLRHTIARPLVSVVQQFDSDRLAADDETLVQELVTRAMLDPPKLRGTEVGSSREGGGQWRPGVDPGTKVSTNRHYIAIQVDGAHDLLEYWPDEDDEGIVPIDAGLDAEDEDASDSDEYNYERELRRHEQWLTTELWSMQLRDVPDSWALFTFVDLTNEEEERVLDGVLNPRAIADANRQLIEPIVERIASQTDRFLREELPQTLRDAVARRRRRVTARAAVRESLTWPEGWEAEPPRLEPSTPSMEGTRARGPSDVALSHRPRLATATFIEVQKIIRVWADAVERYPDAFGSLHEDRLSDLLAATLNASLPGANREVYSRGGKSDIFIRADVLSEGTGPAKIFICECKWWSGPAQVTNHLEQLFGYLEAKDTAAVLIYFVGTQRPHEVRGAARAALITPEWKTEMEAPVVGWPHVRYEFLGKLIEVCVAFIDLPRRKRLASPDRAARKL